MGKLRHKEATDGAELAFEPRSPGSSLRPSTAWPGPVLTEASFEDAGCQGRRGEGVREARKDQQGDLIP